MATKFRDVIHVAIDDTGDEDFLFVTDDGVVNLEPGQRVAIYKKVDEGIVRGPKSFVSSRKK